MATTTREEIQKQYTEGRRDFYYVDFSGLNLCDMVLTGINAEQASFENCDLSYASLRNCELYNANFNNCNCYDTDFAHANLSQANFYNANLYDASFNHAHVQDADFGNVKNFPITDHTLVSTILFQTSGNNQIKRAIAGTILISEDMCWDTLGRLFINNPVFDTPEIRQWVHDTFAPYEELLAKYEYILERFGR